jgi:hypothetical protein
VAAFWCRTPSRPNFGDALTPWLIRAITGHHPLFVRPEDPRPKYIVTGSIISSAGPRCTVWGAGILSRADVVSSKARLLAVRGPLTRARALECGADCPAVLGDPALLLPRFRPPPNNPRRGVAIAPHFSDRPRLHLAASTELRVVDMQGPVEEVVDLIASSELVLSSSLHGLIVSHAYGVPAVWVKFCDLPAGDDSKFRDHLLAMGLDPAPPVRVGYGDVDPDVLVRHASLPAGPPDLEPLWRACPLGRPS